MEITVIDAKTKEPIEGVIFVGYWQKYAGSFAGSNPSGILEVKELITDENGKAGFSGWIEIMFRVEWIREGGRGGVYATYKHGFSDRGGTYRFIDGEVIELPKFEGDDYSQFDESRFLSITSKLRTDTSFACVWERIPNSIVAHETIVALALNKNKESIIKGVKAWLGENPECPSYEVFKKKYL